MQPNNSSTWALFTALSLVLIFAASSFSMKEPDIVAESSSQFSAQSTMQRLSEILPGKDQSHPVNSKANEEFRANIISQLQDLGLEAEIQSAMSCSNGRRTLRCAKVNNIISQISGSNPSQTILLVAHYDSVPAGPGAADAGHAVAIILETLELLQQKPFKNDLVVLINEGEEAGLLGAEAFMKEHPLAKTIDVVINMEARGNQGKSLLFETGENNYRLMKLFQQTAKNPSSNSLAYEIYKLLPNDTDLTVFKRHGITGVNFAFQGRVNHYHTPMDNIENLSPGSVQDQGDNVYAMLTSLLNVDLNSLPEGNAVYTDILSSFMIVWPDYLTLPLIFFAAFLMALVCWQLLNSKNITANQLAVSLPFAFSIVAVSALSCWLLLLIVQSISDQSQPWLSQPIPMRVAIWLFPFATGILFAGLYRDKLGFWGLVQAAALLLLFLSILANYYFPGLSYLTLLPLLTLGILLSVIFITGKISNQLLINTALLLSTLISAVLVFPTLLLLEDAMGFSIAPIFGLLSSLVIILAIPLITFAHPTLIKFLTRSLLILSLVGVAIGTLQKAFTSRSPQHINFEYLQQEDEATIQTLTRQHLPKNIIAESAFSNTVKISRPWSMAEYPSIKTDSANLAKPELEVLSIAHDDQGWQLKVRYTSARETDKFLIYLKDEARLQQISFDGSSSNFHIPVAFDSQYLACVGRDCNGQIFTLTGTGNEPLKLGLVDTSYGLPQSLHYLYQTRGNKAQPAQDGDVSLVHTNIEIAILDIE